MKTKVRAIIFYLFSIRYILLIIVCLFNRNYNFLKKESEIWSFAIYNQELSFNSLLNLLSLKEFRSVLYFRLGYLSTPFKFILRGQMPLQICMTKETIGCGFVLQHGFSTIINAKSIGENVQIWHNVTIGVNKSHTNNRPIIGSNVKICAGAIVIGDIIIGNNVIIGAGSVVTKDVPDNSIVVGNPSKIVK